MQPVAFQLGSGTGRAAGAVRGCEGLWGALGCCGGLRWRTTGAAALERRPHVSYPATIEPGKRGWSVEVACLLVGRISDGRSGGHVISESFWVELGFVV